jgi:hypothetical protein
MTAAEVWAASSQPPRKLFFPFSFGFFSPPLEKQKCNAENYRTSSTSIWDFLDLPQNVDTEPGTPACRAVLQLIQFHPSETSNKPGENNTSFALEEST